MVRLTYNEQLSQGVCKVIQNVFDLSPELGGFKLITISVKRYKNDQEKLCYVLCPTAAAVPNSK